jgi:hypothetical protein
VANDSVIGAALLDLRNSALTTLVLEAWCEDEDYHLVREWGDFI